MSSASHRARMSAPQDEASGAAADELTLRCRADDFDALTVRPRLYSACSPDSPYEEIDVPTLEFDGASVALRIADVARLHAYLGRWLESKTESHPNAAVDQGERADVEAITGCDVCPHASVKFNGGRGAVICRRIAALPAEQRNAVGGSIVAEGFGATPPSFRPIACPLGHGRQHAPRNETAPVAPNGKAATECP